MACRALKALCGDLNNTATLIDSHDHPAIRELTALACRTLKACCGDLNNTATVIN